MKKYIVLLLSMLLTTTLMAQKNKSVELTAEGLPDELLEYMNKSTSDKDKQKENTKVIKEFKSVYNGFDGRLQKRLVDFYAYAVKAKMKGNPEMCNLTRVLTTIATTPAGGKDLGDAYNNVPNLDGFVTSLETFSKRSAKTKAVMEYVDFCESLFSDRILYHSNSCEWRFDKNTPFRLGVKDGMPLVWFETPADLHYASAKDQGVIHGTKGVYNYKENEWQGEGGRVDWTRTGLAADVCYADLSYYKAETKFPKFKADSVLFVHAQYFSTPIPGRIEEVLSVPSEPEKYGYPRFRSTQRDFVMKDIMPGVDYSGSFMMNGSKFITASSKHPAKLIFNHDGRAQLAVTSMKFTITPEKLTAENAAVSIYIGEEDSISNTGINVRYVPAEGQVVLINDPKRNFYSPYIDTYHQLDIYSESILWRMSSGDLVFSNLGASGAVSTSTFESSSYYTANKYRAITGIAETSPVERVYDFMGSNSSEFSVQKFSDYLGLDMSQTLLIIHTLSKHGLVSYNEISGQVKVKDKLVDYQKAFTRSKGYDYDALSLESSTQGANARLTFADNNLLIRGVHDFVVSDSQAVVVYPDSLTGAQVTVGRNRTLHFDGRVIISRFILSVKNCDFNYERYSFNMPVIERLEFYVPDFNQPDKFEQLVRTPLCNLVGTLEVDRPDNHSGLTKNKEYPIFQSLENSSVFYDGKDIQDGRYVRDRFYYTLQPFTINSMTDFVTDSLQFNGVLTSGGIFPDIKEPLRVQKDYYLGFKIETPAGGFPAYGGKGQFTKKVKLDHTGLRGNGELTYLTSTTKAKDFLFLLDSTLAVTDTFSVREEQGFPQIANGKADLHWLPYQDSMCVATLDKGRPFKMYRGESTLRGRVALMPKGASAAGTAEVREGTFVSQHFILASREMNANVSDFTLRSKKFNTVAFSASGVRSNVNYDTRRAELQSTTCPITADLQLARYQAVADHFAWDMDRAQLDLSNSVRGTSEGLDGMDIRQRLNKRGDMPGVRFTSTDPKRKDLTYNSLLSTYKYDLGELSSQGVYLIHVADAAIAPAHDTVHVCKDGEMRVLNHAQLVFNRDSAYHLVVDADLLVKASDSYTGKGYYDFTGHPDKKQRLFLDDISTQAITQSDNQAITVTVAKGTIDDKASFTLSPAFGFAGKVRIEGNQRWPYFEGGVRLIQPCIPQDQVALLAYAGYTDPEHIHVTVPAEPTDWKGHRITASILMDKSTLRPRPAFLTKDKVADNELLAAHGVLTYFGESNEYMIASEEKVADPDNIADPYLALSTNGCIVEGEGPMNFARRKTQASFYSYGTASVGIKESDEDHIASVFGFTFPLASEVVSALYQNLKDELRLEPIGMTTNAEMRHAMMYLYGPDKGAAAYASYSATGELDKIPDEMRSTMLFDNLRWQYNTALGLFCEGKTGLVGVDNKPLGVTVRVKAQLYMDKGSQKLKLYVEAARDHWYFFYYDFSSQDLTIYSSVGTWEDKIKSIPLDQRKISKDGLGTFLYHVGTVANYVPNWLDAFNRSAHPDEEDD
ncbi:MAG: hypothetical protein J6X59_04795 [Bacteroidales bacterium]|nr:hypothetical protein [Bacteroidales bacterium]